VGKRIVGEALVDRVELDGDRAVAVHALAEDGAQGIEAQRIVLAAGAYGSPAMLLRSGIGPPDALHALDIVPLHPLPGVGSPCRFIRRSALACAAHRN
jgi:choline dehydrogenase